MSVSSSSLQISQYKWYFDSVIEDPAKQLKDRDPGSFLVCRTTVHEDQPVFCYRYWNARVLEIAVGKELDGEGWQVKLTSLFKSALAGEMAELLKEDHLNLSPRRNARIQEDRQRVFNAQLGPHWRAPR